jgi:hypothetical protein
MTSLAFFMFSALFSDAEIEPWSVSEFALTARAAKKPLDNIDEIIQLIIGCMNTASGIHPLLVADVCIRH